MEAEEEELHSRSNDSSSHNTAVRSWRRGAVRVEVVEERERRVDLAKAEDTTERVVAWSVHVAKLFLLFFEFLPAAA